jgi:hypothetical protein
MHYFALLLSPQSDAPQEPFDSAVHDATMAAYHEFHTRERSAIKAGDALSPPETAVRISGGPDAPTVVDGPFPESAEIAAGYYVFEADDLDAALALARQIPHISKGAVEVWPMADWSGLAPADGNSWIALLLESPDRPVTPGTPQWNEGAARHGQFAAAAGDHIKGGAGLHPPSTATTVRVRDGEVLLTDGPFVEGAEVANGFYVIAASDRDEAVKVASMIPASSVELRQLAGVSGL